jgi:hypothetical protein
MNNYFVFYILPMVILLSYVVAIGIEYLKRNGYKISFKNYLRLFFSETDYIDAEYGLLMIFMAFIPVLNIAVVLLGAFTGIAILFSVGFEKLTKILRERLGDYD